MAISKDVADSSLRTSLPAKTHERRPSIHPQNTSPIVDDVSVRIVEEPSDYMKALTELEKQLINLGESIHAINSGQLKDALRLLRHTVADVKNSTLSSLAHAYEASGASSDEASDTSSDSDSTHTTTFLAIRKRQRKKTRLLKRIRAMAQYLTTLHGIMCNIDDDDEEDTFSSVKILAEELNVLLEAFVKFGKNCNYDHFLKPMQKLIARDCQEVAKTLENFGAKGVKEFKETRIRATNLQLNAATVGALLGSISATTLQFSFERNNDRLEIAVNVLWIISLSMSVGSALNSLLALSWRQSLRRRNSAILDRWAASWLKHGYLVLLVGASTTFSAGLLCFTLQTQRKLSFWLLVTATCFLHLEIVAVLAWATRRSFRKSYLQFANEWLSNLPQKYQFDLLKKYRDILHDFRGERFRRQMEWDYEESDDDDKPSLLTGRKVWRVQRLAAELHSISFLIYKVATTTSKYFSRLVLVTLNKCMRTLLSFRSSRSTENDDIVHQTGLIMLSNLRQPRDEEAGLSRVLGSNGNEDNEEDTGSQEKPVSTGQHYRTKRPIISLNFSPNGKLLLASSDKETYVFDINSKGDIDVLQTLGHTYNARRVEVLWSSDSKAFVLLLCYWPFENDPVVDVWSRPETSTKEFERRQYEYMYLFDLTYTCESDIVLNANKNTEFFVYNNYVSKRVDISPVKLLPKETNFNSSASNRRLECCNRDIFLTKLNLSSNKAIYALIVQCSWRDDEKTPKKRFITPLYGEVCDIKCSGHCIRTEEQPGGATQHRILISYKDQPAEEWMCTIYHKNDPLRDQLEPLYRYQLLTGEESKDAEYGKSMFIGEKDCQVLLSVEGRVYLVDRDGDKATFHYISKAIRRHRSSSAVFGWNNSTESSTPMFAYARKRSLDICLIPPNLVKPGRSRQDVDVLSRSQIVAAPSRPLPSDRGRLSSHAVDKPKLPSSVPESSQPPPTLSPGHEAATPSPKTVDPTQEHLRYRSRTLLSSPTFPKK